MYHDATCIIDVFSGAQLDSGDDLNRAFAQVLYNISYANNAAVRDGSPFSFSTRKTGGCGPAV